MKFRYYIVDIAYGAPMGTNDETVAKDYSASEEAFVIDTESGNWLVSLDEAEEIFDAKDILTGDKV